MLHIPSIVLRCVEEWYAVCWQNKLTCPLYIVGEVETV